MMKKFSLLAALAVAAIATSCVGDDTKNNGYSPIIQAGIDLYNSANRQNIAPLDFANVAFRLDVLLAEAKAQGVPFEDVYVKLNDGEARLKSILFGSAEITEDPAVPGDYIIDYQTYDKNIFDTAERQGKFRISTGGQLIEELEDGKFWSVAVEAESFILYRITDGYTAYNITVEKVERFTLAPSVGALNTYEIEFEEFRAYMDKKYVSDWRGRYSFTIADNDGFTYEKAVARTYDFSGQGSGPTFNTLPDGSNADLTFRMSGFKYKPGCAPGYFSTGEARASFTGDLSPLPDKYPSAFVLVRWTPRSTTVDCSMTNLTLTYNGETTQF